MTRAFHVVFVATLAASTTAAAQRLTPASPHTPFSREAINRAISAPSTTAATPVSLSSLTVARSGPDINRSWDTLAGTVKPGRKLSITLADATHVEGKLHAIDAQSISIERPGGPRLIQAADVVRVRYAGARKHHVIVGALIGYVAGAVGMLVIDQQSSHPEPGEAASMGGALIGAPLGAIAGAVLPIGPPLYEAARGVRKAP